MMSETLNGKNSLDIKKEMKVIQERLRLLAEKKANEEAISIDMKEFGIQRFVTFCSKQLKYYLNNRCNIRFALKL